MPIKIATVDRQRSLRTLAKGLYDLDDSPELQERAEAALMRANPGLAGEGGIRKGVRVIVPPLRGAAAARDAGGAAPSVAERAAADVEVFRARAERRLLAAETAAKAAAEGVSAAAFKAAVKKTRPDLQADLAGLAAEAAAYAVDAAARGARLREALERAAADVETLKQTRGG